MLLNEGVDPISKATIIPKSAFHEIITASAISAGAGPNEDVSIIGYGLAWFRFSYKGYEVSLDKCSAIEELIVTGRSSRIMVLYLGS